jgi:hypothetical protein
MLLCGLQLDGLKGLPETRAQRERGVWVDAILRMTVMIMMLMK